MIPKDTLRLSSLSALRAFEATVRLGSIKHAASALSLTDGAVSRAVRELEADIGFALFIRANRLLTPTDVAQTLAAEIRDGLDQVKVALARARNTTLTNRPLVLSCEPTFLIRWLIPRLDKLQAAIGSVLDIRFVSAGGPVAFARDGIDFAIRRNDFVIGADVITKPFIDERVGPVCRPELAAEFAYNRPVTGTLLHNATRINAWANWAESTSTTLNPKREIEFEHFYQTLQAANAGAGIAIGPIALVADDIAAGTLVAPLGFVPDGSSYVLMMPQEGAEQTTFDAIFDWLIDEMADLCPKVDV